MPRRTLRSEKKQSRLQFSPLPSSSPVRDGYSDALQDKLPNVRYKTERRNGASRREEIQLSLQALPTPEPSSQPHVETENGQPFSEQRDQPDPTSLPQLTSSEDEDNDVPVRPTRGQTSKAGTRSHKETAGTPRRSARIRTTANTRDMSSPISASSRSFVRVEILSPGEKASDLGSAETSGNEDDVIVTDPAPKRRHQTTAKDDFVVDDGHVEFISSDDEPVTPSKSRKLSRHHKSPRDPRGRSQREQNELAEDLEDLQDLDTEVQETRTRGAPVNKKRDETRKHLEILRRRRAGEKIPLESESDDEGTPVDIEDITREVPRYSISSGDARPDSSDDSDEMPSNSNLDNYEDDFIIDDTSDRTGMHHPDIPLEFTSYASARPRELFIHVIEWLVKNKLSPAFSRHDQLWTLAFQKIDDEVKGQAGSRLISAAWNAPFRRTLEARPNLQVVRLPGDEGDYIRTCDACNRTNHPAQYDFVFHGEAYHHKTLEPIESSEDDDNDDDAASQDSKGHVLPAARQHFYLGRYCAANAEMGHKLSHWLHHLNQNLLTYLEEQGVLSAEQIVQRDKKNHTKREKEAENVVDEMRQTGVIDELWKDFKNDLDDARIGMEGHEKRGGRSKGRLGSIREAPNVFGLFDESD